MDPHAPRIRSVILRYLLSIAAFLGLSATCQVCPFCGQPGCVGGGLVAAFLGFLTATLAHVVLYWNRLVAGIRNWRASRRSQANPASADGTSPPTPSEKPLDERARKS